MWTENRTFQEDLERLANMEYIPWNALTGKRILITGATGLIGYTLVSALLYYGKTRNVDIRVIALVRDLQKGQQKFKGQLADGCELELLQGSVETLPEVEGPVDYIIHGASPTASAYFVEKPVETIMTAVLGTRNVLELAKEKEVAGFVYLSSMEVYGDIASGETRKETDLGYIDLFSLRSSYSESKRMAESLCYAYAGEDAVPATAVRLAQTFGPGVSKEDGRIFAYAARCAMAGEDICLKTSGAKENMYLYTADAASAILLTLTKGERGTAYNAGNPMTYCSVRKLAEIAAQALGSGNTSVLINTDQTTALYPPESHLELNTKRLEEIGWSAVIGLTEMLCRMTAGFEK